MSAGASPVAARRGPRYSVLAALYFSQGLPTGFFVQALPVLMRERGIDLAAIGAASLLGAPWALKFLWAPWVDAHGSPAFGRRRTFIVPAQALTILLLLGTALLDPGRFLPWILALVFVANTVSATQDVATDGLAVDMLAPEERGVGNGIQVGAHRIGMIVGGGFLLLV
ncbi:MAG TPA: MFS transporter, partial [bacterium]|nr:MFS transporter [bacterium]